MTRLVVVTLAVLTMMPLAGQAQAPDTPTAAHALVPLLKDVKARLRPRVGIVPGNPQPSPFTGTQTTLFSIGIGKRSVPVDPKVAKAIDQLLAWKIDAADGSQTADAVLFDHWLTQLTVKAAAVGVLNCDAACVVAKFTAPDEAFGKSRNEREEMRDQLLLDALADAVDELEER
jgi:hypothetical protein